MRVIERHLRSLFAAVIAAGWLGVVGLLAFVFPASNRYTGRVVAISEAAQVMVLRDGQPQSLRLAEVNLPKKGHPHARVARAFANRLALGRDVAVEETRFASTGSVDGLPPAADADTDEIEGASPADGSARSEAGSVLGEN